MAAIQHPTMSRQATDATLAVPAIKEAITEESTAKQPHIAATSSASGKSSRAPSPTPSHQLHHTFSAKDYFDGPQDLEKHSKLPYFLRLSGSVLPRLVVPLIFVAAWSTAVTCVSHFVYPLIVDSLMLTVLGFVIGLAISFRTSSAYERYSDGRKFWTEVLQTSRDLCRHIWIHVEERHGKDAALGRADLLSKVTAMNLILTFAVSLKHKLRFEPYVNHDDLEHLVTHLQTYAGEALDPKLESPPKGKSSWKAAGEYLDICFAQSNPRKAIKTSRKNLGNLPMEILMHLNAYLEGVKRDGTLDLTVYGMALANVQTLNSAMAGTERVLNTPLPVAYSIAIAQITWVYLLALPFQLYDTLGWITIPACILAAYVILALATIGREIENPFGHDTNDLPLDSFCHQLAQEIDVFCSRPQFQIGDFVQHEKNTPMFNRPYAMWHQKTTEEIRDTLRMKATIATMVNNPIESEKIFSGPLHGV